MAGQADIVVFGTGSFAARIVFDLAATAQLPVRVAVGGRNAERLSWLKVAANARAHLFGRPAVFVAHTIDLLAPGAVEEAIATCRPVIVVQAASSQPSSVISRQDDAWSQLVAIGGLSATAVFQAQLSARVARALQTARPGCHLINCCFPDVVNSMLAAAGLPVTCGTGNVAILSNAFAGELGLKEPSALKMLAHYQTLGPWRRAAATRAGPAPRVWIDDEEVADVYATFAAVKITPEPAIEISGASGVPLMLAVAAGAEWRGHVPGPNGLPGGYPVAYRDGRLDLDLPAGLGRAEAIQWNARFEAENGLVVEADGKIRYTGVLYEQLRKASPALAAGFEMKDLEDVYTEMTALRAQLQARAAL
jgi:hypothetical protein